MPVDFAFRETSGHITVEWTVRDFASLPKARQYLLTSPPALVGNTQLFIRMYPNEHPHILVGLGRKFPTGQKQDMTFDFKFYHDDELMIAIGLQKYDFRTETSPMSLVNKFAIFHSPEFETPGFDLRIVCSISVDGTLSRLKTESDVELVIPSRKNNKSIDSLLQHLRDLFLSGSHCDVTISVGGREFRAHRALLAVRSPVFASMFRYETLEKASGTVSVPDCDPQAFGGFLEYLYTGQVGDVEPEDLPAIYVMGAKYDVPELRREVVDLLRRRTTVGAFCEVLLVASVYEEEDLMRIAEDFFVHNFKQIFRCPAWKELLVEHPELANRLFQNVAERRESP